MEFIVSRKFNQPAEVPYNLKAGRRLPELRFSGHQLLPDMPTRAGSDCDLPRAVVGTPGWNVQPGLAKNCRPQSTRL